MLALPRGVLLAAALGVALAGACACSGQSKAAACSPGGSCVPATPCRAGIVACTGGVASCADAGSAAADGTPCGSGLVCATGACVAACLPGQPCTPGGTPDPCKVYRTSCASSTATATCGPGGDAADGTPCGGILECVGGACVGTSTGCGAATAPATGALSLSVQVGAATRTFQALVPSGYVRTQPYPVVFVFHGANGTSGGAMGFGIQDAPGAADGAIFAYPQGVDFTEGGTDYGIGWNEHCDGYDMPFFDAMLQRLSATYCVDRRRVFAAGFSWGADFANNLGCCRGGRVRAVAPSSGADADYNPACTSPLPALRLSYADNDAYPQSAFDLTIALYRAGQGCSTGTSDPVAPAPCVSYRGCAAPVVECRYPGLGHNLPPGWGGDVWSWFSTFP